MTIIGRCVGIIRWFTRWGLDMAIDLDDILASTNVAELLSDSELSDLGSQVVDDYTKSKGSRSEW